MTIGRLKDWPTALSTQIFRHRHSRAATPPKPAGTPRLAHAAQPKPVPVVVSPQPDPAPDRAARPVTGVSPLFTTAIVFVVTIFILLQREDLRDRRSACSARAICTEPPSRWTMPARRLSRYFLTQLGSTPALA